MTTTRDLTVYITGATAGFGAACARRFINEGARGAATNARQSVLDGVRYAPSLVLSTRGNPRS